MAGICHNRGCLGPIIVSFFSAELDFDVTVIGAGAAGMMCAAIAGQRGRRAVLVEHAPKLGEKIRISGGGRCNFTNVHCKPENFLSRNPDFCRSALARYTPRDFIALVEKHVTGQLGGFNFQWAWASGFAAGQCV